MLPYRHPAAGAGGRGSRCASACTRLAEPSTRSTDARSTYEVGAPEVTRLFERAKTTFDCTLTEIARKDSLELTSQDREALRTRVLADDCPLILITHGTDTMTETARALAGITGKTIVLTAHSSPRASSTAMHRSTSAWQSPRCRPVRQASHRDERSCLRGRTGAQEPRDQHVRGTRLARHRCRGLSRPGLTDRSNRRAHRCSRRDRRATLEMDQQQRDGRRRTPGIRDATPSVGGRCSASRWRTVREPAHLGVVEIRQPCFSCRRCRSISSACRSM